MTSLPNHRNATREHGMSFPNLRSTNTSVRISPLARR